MEPKQVARYLFNLQSREVLSSRQLDLHYFKHRSIVFISLPYSLVGTPKISHMMCLCCAVPEGTLRKRDNTDSTSKSASMPHSQTLASMAWIRCHARSPAVRYVCLPLRILCPFNHGPTPRCALRLNHSRGMQETMPRC